MPREVVAKLLQPCQPAQTEHDIKSWKETGQTSGMERNEPCAREIGTHLLQGAGDKVSAEHHEDARGDRTPIQPFRNRKSKMVPNHKENGYAAQSVELHETV